MSVLRPPISLLGMCLVLGGGSLRAEILFNGATQGSVASIQAGDSIVGSGTTAGVSVGDAGDQLTVSGGTVDISGAGSVGVRVLGGSVTMSGGSVRGVASGVQVQGGVFEFSGGGIRDGVTVEGAGSLFAMSGGTILNRDFVASSGGAIVISGGLVSNSRVEAVGLSSRIDVKGGTISWLDAIDGGEGHVYGTAFTVNNMALDLAGADQFVLPPTAGHMGVTYANRTSGSFKVIQSTGGTITLHLLPPGDFTGDGAVDGADLLAWQRGQVGSSIAASDLATWSAGFGASGAISAAATAVPEPSSWLVAILGTTTAIGFRRFRERSCSRTVARRQS